MHGNCYQHTPTQSPHTFPYCSHPLEGMCLSDYYSCFFSKKPTNDLSITLALNTTSVCCCGCIDPTEDDTPATLFCPRFKGVSVGAWWISAPSGTSSESSIRFRYSVRFRDCIGCSIDGELAMDEVNEAPPQKPSAGNESTEETSKDDSLSSLDINPVCFLRTFTLCSAGANAQQIVLHIKGQSMAWWVMAIKR